MVLEWAVFHAVRMFEYHDIDRNPEAIVGLAEIMARRG
jgi:hypothetical protein